MPFCAKCLLHVSLLFGVGDRELNVLPKSLVDFMALSLCSYQKDPSLLSTYCILTFLNFVKTLTIHRRDIGLLENENLTLYD